MADQPAQQQPAAIAAPFPTPPPFYKHFTKQNLARLRQIRKETTDSNEIDITESNGDSSNTTLGIDILSLPPELRYLLPPPPPKDDKYTTFGNAINLHAPEQTLADSGIEQLYPDHPDTKLNPQPHLISLARSLLTTFLSLVGILSANPEQFEGKVEDLQTICYNMHDLINRYRPHQARESVILMMEERIARLKSEIEQIEGARGRVGELLRGIGEQKKPTVDETNGGATSNGSVEQKDEATLQQERQKARREARQRAAWRALEAEMADEG